MSSLDPIPSDVFSPAGSPLADKLTNISNLSNSLREIAWSEAFLVRRLANGMAVDLNPDFFRKLVQGKKRLAKVSAWELIGSNDSRWRYTMKEVRLSGQENNLLAFAPTGENEVQFVAFNLTEINNVPLGDGTQGNSVDDSGTDFAATAMTLQPVGGGTGGVPGNEVIVECTERRTSDGVVVYTFEYQNAVDGECS